MAQQEGGWPLGLQLLNGTRAGFANRNIIHDRNGSISFGTLLTGSPTSSTVSSSDLDTESTGSFFHEKSITLGSLIGILDLSRRSIRVRPAIETSREKKSCKTRPWIFSLCSKLSTDIINTRNNNDNNYNSNNNNNDVAPSLSHYLEAERRAASMYRRDQSPFDGLSPILASANSNSLFIGERRDILGHGNGYGSSPLSLSRLCGYIAN